MNRQQIDQAFDRAKEQGSAAWSGAEVVKIIDDLQQAVHDYLAMPEDIHQPPPQPERSAL